jgi:hypothetical protein
LEENHRMGEANSVRRLPNSQYHHLDDARRVARKDCSQSVDPSKTEDRDPLNLATTASVSPKIRENSHSPSTQCQSLGMALSAKTKGYLSHEKEIARCIGRESNPGLADIKESLEIKSFSWQRPILPLNHQCCA